MFARKAAVFAVSFASTIAVSSLAFAQDPAPKIVTPAPGQAAAAAPSPTPQAITATCSLGDHPGVEDAEAHTAADLVCHELAKQGATNTAHEIRFGKLGGKTLVTVASRNGNTYDERRTLLTGMDELPVAAPRLAGSLSDGRALEETKNVDNVLDSEARRAKVQPGQMGFEMGLFGMTGMGAASGASGGVDLGIVYRATSFAVTSRGRAGGIGSSEEKLGTASLDVGGRYYLSSSDTAPFLGAGIELIYLDATRSGSDADGSGMGAFGELGIETLRSNHVALTASLRVDAPFFALQGYGTDSLYVAPVSLNAGLLFH